MSKSKLTNELIDRAVKHIKAGNYAVVVCQYLGIAETTYYDWIKKADADTTAGKNSIYTKFAKSIKEADAEAEMRNMQIIQKAAIDTWQAAAWYMERKHKERYALKSTTEITGQDGKALTITLVKAKD